MKRDLESLDMQKRQNVNYLREMVRVFFTFHWPFRTELLYRISFDTEAFWKQQEGAMGWSSHRWVCTAKWLRSKNEQKYIITVIYQTAIRKETPLQMISLLLSKSPESATTVVYFLSCSRAEAISAALFLAKSRGWAVSGVYVGKYGTFSFSIHEVSTDQLYQRFLKKQKEPRWRTEESWLLQQPQVI